MTHARPRTGMMVGLAAAAGAFGAAAMMSAPTARADDFTDVVNVVDADYAAGQADFTAAAVDFSGGDLVQGLAALFDGADDDALNAPNDLLVGTVEALTNESIGPSDPFNFVIPADFSDASTDAQQIVAESQSFFTNALSAFSAGDYGDALNFDLIGADDSTIVPLEVLILGAAVSL